MGALSTGTESQNTSPISPPPLSAPQMIEVYMKHLHKIHNLLYRISTGCPPGSWKPWLKDGKEGMYIWPLPAVKWEGVETSVLDSGTPCTKHVLKVSDHGQGFQAALIMWTEGKNKRELTQPEARGSERCLQRLLALRSALAILSKKKNN